MNTTTHRLSRQSATAPGLWVRTRDELRAAREARAARRALQRDLEPYQTPAEVSDLLALVSDRDDAEAEQFRNVLLGNAAYGHRIRGAVDAAVTCSSASSRRPSGCGAAW
jgi:hypothetical protein